MTKINRKALNGSKKTCKSKVSTKILQFRKLCKDKLKKLEFLQAKFRISLMQQP